MVTGLVLGSVPSAATEIAAGAQPFLPQKLVVTPLRAIALIGPELGADSARFRGFG